MVCLHMHVCKNALAMLVSAAINLHFKGSGQGYNVIVALTGLPIGYSVIVALTGLPIGYSVIVALLLQVVLLEDVNDFHQSGSFENVEKKIIKNCGHAISVEHPYKAATEIVTFIRKHSSY